MKKDNSKIIFLNLFFLLSFLFCIILITQIVFLLGGTIQPFILLSSFILSIATSIYIFKDKCTKKTIIYSILFNIIIFSLLLSLAGLFHDISWDGRTYHQNSIIALKNGWNPLYENILADQNWTNYWENIYPKATWILSANLNIFTNNIEYSKVFNFIFLLISVYMVLAVLSKTTKISFTNKLLLTFIITVNPVVIQQLFTFYLDGILYSLLITVIFLLYYIFRYRVKTPKYIYIMLFMTLSILFNIKFTGLAYAIITLFVFASFLLYFKRYTIIKQNIMFLVTLFIVGIIFLGYNPYTKNIINDRHIFYPLMGADKITFEQSKPKIMKDNNRIHNLYLSLFTQTSNNRNFEPTTPFPLSLKNLSWKDMKYDDVRIGGFGPLFGLTLIFAFILILDKLFSKSSKRYIKYFLFFFIAILAGVLANPESWWSRYVPQLWLFPAMAVFLYLYSPKRAVLKFVSYSIMIMMIITICFTSYYTLQRVVKFSNQIDTKIKNMKKEKRLIVKYDNKYPFKTSLENLLNENNINHINSVDYKGKKTLLYKTIDLRKQKGVSVYVISSD